MRILFKAFLKILGDLRHGICFSLASSFDRTAVCDAVHMNTRPVRRQPLHNFILLILEDSHGKNGRRGLEDGGRQRSQIR
jgi:hypothetical protein